MYQLDINIVAVGDDQIQWTAMFTYEDDTALTTCSTAELCGTKDQFRDFCESFKYVIGQIGPESEKALFEEVFRGGANAAKCNTCPGDPEEFDFDEDE